MSYLHQDLPSPGRFSLARVFAARLGHARRRGRAEAKRCIGCMDQGDYDCCRHEAASACTEVGADRWEPLSREELARIWKTSLGCTAFFLLLSVAVLWVWKP